MEEGKEKKITNENLEPEKELKQEQNANVQNQEENLEKTQEKIVEENTKELGLIKEERKRNKKGSYLAGIIGAISGGFVAALLWILTYIFASNMVIPIFASFIPIGTYLGYKIFRGKKGKLTAGIITVISLLIIVLVTTAICPAILLLQSGYAMSWENLIGLYSDTREEIRLTILEDSVAGLVFNIIGIIVVIKIFVIKRKTVEEKILLQQAMQNKLREQSQIIKNACLDLESTNKEKATKKKKILKQITRVYNLKTKKAKLYFIKNKKNKLIKKYKGKYYYDETDEERKIAEVKKLKKRYISKKTKFMLILILTLIIAAIAYVFINKKESYKINSGIEIQVDETQDYYGNDEIIANAFGENFASYYDFILIDKNKKYELYGTEIPSYNYEVADFAAIMQEDRDYFAPYIGEENVSEVQDRQFNNKAFKVYYYTYIGNDGNQYRAGIYLYEGESIYLWINIYSDFDLENTDLDTIIDNLIK